jgi:hypothetical protein
MNASYKPSVLTDVVSKVLDASATAFEVEYKDGLERVFARNGTIGVGVAAYRSDGREAQELRRQLYAMGRRRKKIEVSGVEYVLRVEIFDSFGEDGFRVTVQRS